MCGRAHAKYAVKPAARLLQCACARQRARAGEYGSIGANRRKGRVADERVDAVTVGRRCVSLSGNRTRVHAETRDTQMCAWARNVVRRAKCGPAGLYRETKIRV